MRLPHLVTEHNFMSSAFSLLSCLCDVPLAFVDVETTGASAAWGDRVIEVGVVRGDLVFEAKVMGIQLGPG